LTAADAQTQLGDSVHVYLEAGAPPVGEASTIIDLTPISRGTGLARILRLGAVSAGQLRDVLGENLEPDTEPVG
jgi:tRNA A37 threonylcarbamoyladenosine synthetase subunit TsaC/SUA5/YrdC